MSMFARAELDPVVTYDTAVAQDREQRLCTASSRGVGVGKGAILWESMAVTL